MNSDLIVDDLISSLAKRFGAPKQVSKGRVFTFGSSVTCSINYSKLLGGHKFFYAIPQDMLNPAKSFPKTRFGEFVLLICGSANNVLVLPRALVIEMMQDVPTRRVDVFCDSDTYILQTTKHPKLAVTDFLNAFPSDKEVQTTDASTAVEGVSPDRLHVKIQWALIMLGRAEGCSVWVPVNDRNLSYQKRGFTAFTLGRLPNFGFDENTRRIVQNIDVLWLTRNVIQKAFEIESTTSIYSGLLRLNDLVLAQPNNNIELYVLASQGRREKVRNQLGRPSFLSLLPVCKFISFESIDEQLKRLESFSLDTGARITGLLRGEQFALPQHFVYPSDL